LKARALVCGSGGDGRVDVLAVEDLRPLHELVSGKKTLRKSGRDKIEASHPLGLTASVGVDRQGDMTVWDLCEVDDEDGRERSAEWSRLRLRVGRSEFH